MNLPTDIRRQLEALVQEAVGEPAQIPVLRTLVGSEALQRVPGGMNSWQLAQWVVGYSLTRSSPGVFLGVVQISDPAKELVALYPLVEELSADSSKWVSGADGLWVPDGWPFIDRKPLRDALTAMAEGAGPPVLSIEGPFGHGKETMSEYACYLGREAKSFVPLVLKLRMQPDPGLLKSVATQVWMVLDQPPDTETTHTEPERQAAILARQLVEAAFAASTPTWLVAHIEDHMGLAEEGIIAFLDELLRLVQETPSLPNKLRILILCDQLSLLELKNAPPLESRHTLGQVGAIEVREWLEAATPGKPADVYDYTTSRLMDRLELENPPVGRRLETLSQHCKRAQKTLSAMV